MRCLLCTSSALFLCTVNGSCGPVPAMPPSLSECVDHYKCMCAVFCRLQTLFESGMLDATETSALSHPVEAAERRLELLGPVWRAPSVLEVLRQLPFMRGQPQSVLEFFLRSVAAPGQRGTTWAGPRRSAWQTSQSNSLGGARRVERNCAPEGFL